MAWLVLWLLCVAAIVVLPAWQVVPLDVIWISLSLLYGLRIWPSRRMLALTCIAVAVTAAALGDDAVGHLRVAGGSVTQIPLVAIIVVVMAWQAHRWVIADHRQQRDGHVIVSELERLQTVSDQLLLIAACLDADVPVLGPAEIDALVADLLAHPPVSSVTLTTSIGRRRAHEDGSG
jgi:hypothetical protein